MNIRFFSFGSTGRSHSIWSYTSFIGAVSTEEIGKHQVRRHTTYENERKSIKELRNH